MQSRDTIFPVRFIFTIFEISPLRFNIDSLQEMNHSTAQTDFVESLKRFDSKESDFISVVGVVICVNRACIILQAQRKATAYKRTFR